MRKTRRWNRQREKRIDRVMNALAATRGDHKRNNRKTRIRQLHNYARSSLASLIRKGRFQCQQILSV